MSRRRVLVLFAHPSLEKSRVNVLLVQEARKVEGVTFHDLYEAYPEFDVDVAREQELLAGHDTIVAQHPFFWYSTPALLKQWEDLVLEHGWAYGTEGRALEGKWWLTATTAGGRESAYGPNGLNRYSMTELLRPLEQTVRLCRMVWLPPFVAHGTHRMEEATMRRHGADFGRLLEALRDGMIDPGRLGGLSRINLDLDAVLGSGRGAS